VILFSNYLYSNVLFNLVKELDPDGRDRRANDMQRNAKFELIIKGLDWLWSIDGYDKFSKYGIKMYDAIDAFSRCIIWIYVDVSNRIQRSVYT
jgi:hypothetical protein